ncbi:hypothetical protein KHU50_004477 [Colletotrichum sp. SAR 10_65]|nr:hypothetical protein KHU50_004477 [Colletotrichum sp. SAR 10_65]KAJ5004508.1 hypothetical protein K4K48_009498 [Colletotrichum sp. SAR 10_66]
MGHYSPIKPLALRREVGLMVILSMIGAVVGLIYLKLQEQRLGGLLRPTTNFEVLQLLENYIPTVFATLLEPFWVLVNRLLCILQPFKDLWRGQRRAKGTINARYTSVPPQFVMWRAAKAGHLALAAICLLALLSNLLAVGLGGLFNEIPVVVNKTCTFQQSIKPIMNNNSVTKSETQSMFTGNSIDYYDPFYIAMNNYTKGTPLPAWVNKNYFFQPFAAVPDDGIEREAYTAPTRGFGVVPQCSALGSFKSQGKSPTLNYTFTRGEQEFSECPTTFHDERLDLDKGNADLIITGVSAAETVSLMRRRAASANPCQIPLFLSWARSPNINLFNKTEIETWFVVCEPVFTTSMFNVTVDSQGQILQAVQTSEASSTLDYPLSTNNTDAISTYLNGMLDSVSYPFHNDTLSKFWMSYLLKVQPDTENILDPTTTPNTTAIVPSVEAVYSQLYALILSLNVNWFENYTEPITIVGTERHAEIRIFMDTTAFVISLSVLGLNIAVALLLYGGSIKHFLPRLPTTIGSLLAYVAPSRAVREYDGPNGFTNATFSFGRYLGEDGRTHVGIEMDPFVVPVKLSALRKGDTEPRTGLLRRVLGRKKPGRGEPWL